MFSLQNTGLQDLMLLGHELLKCRCDLLHDQIALAMNRVLPTRTRFISHVGLIQ